MYPEHSARVLGHWDRLSHIPSPGETHDEWASAHPAGDTELSARRGVHTHAETPSLTHTAQKKHLCSQTVIYIQEEDYVSRCKILSAQSPHQGGKATLHLCLPLFPGYICHLGE